MELGIPEELMSRAQLSAKGVYEEASTGEATLLKCSNISIGENSAMACVGDENGAMACHSGTCFCVVMTLRCVVLSGGGKPQLLQKEQGSCL